MEKFQEDILEATKYFRTADHLACVTYPLLKDNKILWTIAKNLYLTSYKGVSAVLHYEQLYRRIRLLPVDYDLRIQIFERDVAPRMKIDRNVLNVVKSLRILMQKHKESAVEFSRNNRIIICDEEYTQVKTLDLDMLKSYILVMRSFLYFIGRFGKDV